MPDTKVSSNIARELFLRAFLAQNGGGDSVSRIADAMRDLRVPAGETFFRAGEPPEYTYFVVEGEVRLSAPDEAPWTFGSRSVVGAIDVMADRPRARTAVALVDSHLLQLRGEDWLDILEENFEMTRSTVLNVASGLAEAHLATPIDGGFPQPGSQPVLKGTGPLDHVARMLALRRVRLLERAGVQVLASLASEVDERRVQVDELLFDRQQDPGGLYFVVQGVVDVAFESAPVRALFGPGELVGGAAAFNGGRNAARAHARAPTVLLRLGEESFFDEMEEHFILARSAFAHLSLEREALMLRKAKRARVTAESRE